MKHSKFTIQNTIIKKYSYTRCMQLYYNDLTEYVVLFILIFLLILRLNKVITNSEINNLLTDHEFSRVSLLTKDVQWALIPPTPFFFNKISVSFYH